MKDILLDGRMITPSSPQLHRKPLGGSREIFLYGRPGFTRQGAVLPPVMLYRRPKRVPTALSRVSTAAAAMVLTGGYLVLASCAGSSEEGFKDGPPPKELEAEAKAQKQSGLPTVGQPPAASTSITPPAKGTAPASSLPSVGAAPPPGSTAAPAPPAAPVRPDIVGTPTGRSNPKPTAEQQKQALTRGLIGDKAHAQYTDEEIRQIGEGEAEPARPTRQVAQTPQSPAPVKPTDAPVPPATPTTPVTSAPASQLPTPQPQRALPAPAPTTPQVATEIPVPDPVPPPPAPPGTSGVTLKRPPIVVEQSANPPPPAVVADAAQSTPSASGGPSSSPVILRPPPAPPSVGPRKGAVSASDPMPTPNVLQPETQLAEATPGGQVQLRPPAPYAAPAPLYTQSQPVMMQPHALPPVMPVTPYSFGSAQHLSSILFEHGSASLSPVDQQLIAQIASGIRATGSRLRIVGHASSRTSDMDIPSHNEANYRISMARAQAIAGVLIANGVPAQNIIIEAQANDGALFFETMPSGEAGNRRADIFVDS